MLKVVIAVCLVSSCVTSDPEPRDEARLDLGDHALIFSDTNERMIPDAEPQAPGKSLVLVLHGMGGTGASVRNNWHLDDIDGDDVVVLTPDGDDRKWQSGASSCCSDSLGGTTEQLADLVEAHIATGEIDTDRVYVWGQSNGGSMAWRLMCDYPDLFRSAVMQAGTASTAADVPCQQARFSMLIVHGTADPMIAYDPPTWIVNDMPEPYAPVTGPDGALDQAEELAACTGVLEVTGLAPIDNNSNKDVLQWSGGCTNGYAEHWRFNNGGHSPPFTESLPIALLAWSNAHRTSL